MQITLSYGDAIASIELPDSATLADLAAAVASATGAPPGRTVIMKDGAPLAGPPSAAAAAAGVAHGDVLAVAVDAGGAGAPAPSHQQQPPALAFDPALFARLAASLPRPPGSSAAPPPPPPRIDPAAATQAAIDALNADPFNPEHQKKIEELMRRQAVEENMAAAMDEHPEAFGEVVMLYVNLKVNGVPMKAFVDSGAQRTIMSKQDAEKCGILRLMDDRFAGLARGVGAGRILGRVHSVPVSASGGGDGAASSRFFPLAITIMEDSSMPFLLGLDALRGHRATIDVGPANCLRFPELGVALPFLSEHELPPSARAAFSGDAGAAAPASDAPAPPAAATTDDHDAKIARLTALAPSITPAAAAAALRRAGGDEAVAASLLFDGLG